VSRLLLMPHKVNEDLCTLYTLGEGDVILLQLPPNVGGIIGQCRSSVTWLTTCACKLFFVELYTYTWSANYIRIFRLPHFNLLFTLHIPPTYRVPISATSLHLMWK